MDPERWQRIKKILQAALEVAPVERRAFLSQQCGGDRSLLKEIESLIVAYGKDGSFIDKPAFEMMAKDLSGVTTLKVGQSIGHYKVVSALGRGGMGEVYLAEDTKLHRKVAIKALAADSIADHDANQRLLREAQAAAKLDHPHICAVHEVAEDNGSFSSL